MIQGMTFSIAKWAMVWPWCPAWSDSFFLPEALDL